jgi:hypothetical protein
MKSIIFKSAISNRNKIRFLYGLNEIILEPYYISRNKIGKKVIYGRVERSSEIKMFEYDMISNIKILDWNKFTPIIPILPVLN